MNNLEIVRQSILFFGYVLIQVFFLKNFGFFEVAFCFLYINFILLLPLEIDKALSLLAAFALGFLVDNFYDTLGIHSFACVMIAFLRPFLIPILFVKEELVKVSIKEDGLITFSLYAVILIFIHHLFIFFIEVGNFRYFGMTLVKVLLSTLFTYFVVILIQYLFYTELSKR